MRNNQRKAMFAKMGKKSKKTMIITEMQKYPAYAVPAKWYLRNLSEKELKKNLIILEDIFNKGRNVK